MIRKSILLLIVSLLLVNTVFAYDVAVVVKSSANPTILLSLQELGFNYQVITESQILSTDFSDFSILFIQDNVINKDSLPLDTMDAIFIDKNIIPIVWPNSIVYNSQTFTTNFEQLGTAFSEGFTQTQFNAYTQAKPINYLKVKPGYVHRITLTTGSTGSYGITAYSDIVNGNDHLKDVFFGFSEINYWTADTKKLFKNSVKWLILGEDRDGDGVISDNDCNDNDATVWQNLPGYRDADSDGFGGGVLLDVCSGDILPNGYVNIDGDCNDNDPNVWRIIRAYSDLDLDGHGYGNLLDVCSGENLPTGYVLDNNNDCNDLNANLWQNLPGYRDADNDEVGAGNLTQVCSGNSLPNGYVDENVLHNDCDDNNPGIWQIFEGYRDVDGDNVGGGNKLFKCSGDELNPGYAEIGGDCNDNNNDIWQNLTGYIDLDLDGYGAGNSSQICSGDILPEGYSDNNLDCNDNDYDINPDMIDIPYNRIDENCNGFDLADIDGDGYCKSGYQVSNFNEQCPKEIGFYGSDCNDNDPLFNIGSSDLTKNCINDPPIIQPMEKITVQESENVAIIVNATDPEGDFIIYNINNPRFSRNNNIFTWTTNYGDSGNYTFIVNASDAKKSNSIEISVEVLKKNRKPVCNIIPIINFHEDENFILDINSFCSDPDNDTLTYSVKEKSRENLILNILDDNIKISSIENYNGNEWVIFDVSDNYETISTNKININISPVNDAPVFSGNIDNQNWNEGTNLVNAIDLKQYFSDVDNNNLTFSYSGIDNIDVIINNGLVSFYPFEDWYGVEKIIFTASDGILTVDSNEVSLNVGYINKLPKFGELDCETNILEDTEYNCEIIANDIENEILTFSIGNQNNLNCSFEGNTLSYIGNQNYYGPASCVLKVTDTNNNAAELLFRVQIENINDPPDLADYFPMQNQKLIANTDYRFSVLINDNDSPKNITWFIENYSVGTGNFFIFNKPKGTYKVSMIDIDNEFNITKDWNVIVGNIGEFTCSQVNGNICNENQTCSSQFLGVYDSERCCASSCTKTPPEFKSIKNITNALLSQNIKVNIKDPKSYDNLYTGTKFKVNTEIENNLGEEADFDLEVYLYDDTKDKIISKEKTSFNIDKNTIKTLDVEISIPDDIDDTRTYYLIARAVAKTNAINKYYNINYFEANIIRKDHDIRIKSFNIDPEAGIICSDNIDIKVDVQNYGRTDEDLLIKMDIPQLKINDKSDVLTIERFGEDDKASVTFNVNIPKNIKQQEYTININATINSQTKSESKKILVECKTEKSEISPVEIIQIKSNNPQIKVNNKSNEKSNLELFISLNLLSVVLVAIIVVLTLAYRRKMNKN